jgi:hypothetical protein
MNNFEDIAEDIIWRKDELLTCKTLPFLHDFTDIHKEFLIKHSIPIIYSIWEGFVQTSFQTYIRELNKLNLTRFHYCNNIIIHTLESKFPQFKEYPVEYRKKDNFITNLEVFLAGQFEISNKVNTESNVAFDVLNKLLSKFNLQEIPNHPFKQGLKDLLMQRNRIAHGDNSLVVNSTNFDDFVQKINDFIILIEELMELIHERFKEGYNVKKSYLKNAI